MIATSTVTAPSSTGLAKAERCTSGATSSLAPEGPAWRLMTATGSNGGSWRPRSSARDQAAAAPSQSPARESSRPSRKAPYPSPCSSARS